MPIGADAQGSLTNHSMAATPAADAPTNVQGGPGIPAQTTEERDNPKSELQPWSDTEAAKIAMGDFKKAEAYRTINHDWRFRVSDQLYLAWTQRKTWEGTKIPRSSIGIFLALEQIEALLPNVVLALFPDNNQLPFSVEPRPTSTGEQAQAVRDLLAYQLQDLGNPGQHLTLREIVRRSYKQSYVYGNGIVEFGWMDKNIPRTKFDRVPVPIRQVVPHPITGENIAVPTGQFTFHVRKTLTEQRMQKPWMKDVDIRDFYWDPNCSSHNIQDGGFCATRHLMTINQIEQYRDVEGFNIPDRAGLAKLAQIKTTSQGDMSKMNQESFRGMTYQPSIDYTTDPALQRIEVIRYFQPNRQVWMLGRQWVAFNKTNQLSILPFLDAFYVDVPGRFAGLSICDLVEGDQKLAEAIVNARIDELNLLIHPPIIKKQGRSFSAAQQKLRPGVIWDAEDPKNDYIRMEMGNVTAAAYVEVEALETRVQRKVGASALSVLGSPASGGNSANRTAAGVQAQQSGTSARIQYQVENIEDQFLVPALGILHSLNQIFLDPDEMVKVLGPEAQLIPIDPVDILNADVMFRINASGKMKLRQAMLTGGLELMFQTALNPEMITLASQAGWIPDWAGWMQLLTDSFGLPPRTLYRQGQPQELQMMQMQRMMPEIMKRQIQQDRLQSHEQVADSKDDTILIKTLLEKIITPQAAHAFLDEYMGTELGKLDQMQAQRPQLTNGKSSTGQGGAGASK